MKQAYGAINRQAEVNHTQVLNRTLLILNWLESKNDIFLLQK